MTVLNTLPAAHIGSRQLPIERHERKTAGALLIYDRRATQLLDYQPTAEVDRVAFRANRQAQRYAAYALETARVEGADEPAGEPLTVLRNAYAERAQARAEVREFELRVLRGWPHWTQGTISAVTLGLVIRIFDRQALALAVRRKMQSEWAIRAILEPQIVSSDR